MAKAKRGIAIGEDEKHPRISGLEPTDIIDDATGTASRPVY
jgi:hypothetical protein